MRRLNRVSKKRKKNSAELLSRLFVVNIKEEKVDFPNCDINPLATIQIDSVTEFQIGDERISGSEAEDEKKDWSKSPVPPTPKKKKVTKGKFLRALQFKQEITYLDSSCNPLLN